jgi:hypothetical protein
MHTRVPFRTIFSLVLAVLGLAASRHSPSQAVPSLEKQVEARTESNFGKLQLSLEPNIYQTPKDVQWLARESECTASG